MGKKGKYNNNNKNDDDEPKKKKFMITEEHLMDKTHMDSTEFLSFVPADALYFPYALPGLHALKKMVTDLNYLLYLDFKSFWATILYNPSLKNCLTNCLKFFHRRCLNKYEDQLKKQEAWELIKDDQTTDLTSHLMKLVLFIYFRIVHCVEEGPQLSKLYKLEEEISIKYLLNIPRLLEIIQIYGESNPDIVKVITKNYLKAPEFYNELTTQIFQIMMNKMNKNIFMIKKITDREEFGINFSYKRTQPGQLSPGEEELKKKVSLLVQILSFYTIIENIQNFFPEKYVDYTRFESNIHLISENIFIEISEAYKVWDTHEKPKFIHSLMNDIQNKIIDYFVIFYKHSKRLIVTNELRSGTTGAYVKSLERIFQNYGKRSTLGKKIGNNRDTLLYELMQQKFDLQEFLRCIYVDQIENGTYGINIEYLVDFKFVIDDLVKKNQKKDQQQQQEQEVAEERQAQIDEETIADNEEQDQKIQEKKNNNKKVQEPQEQKLQMLISKKNREDNYYQKLYKDYRTKITVDYDDQYDDLVDHEKKPLFADKEPSSSDLDSDYQQLHLVKNESNTSRNRANISNINKKNRNEREKYQRKGKTLYVSVKDNEKNRILQKQKGKKTYTEKNKTEKKAAQTTIKQKGNKEYEDEVCNQECKMKLGQQREYEVKKPYNNNNKSFQGNGKNKSNKYKPKYVQKQ